MNTEQCTYLVEETLAYLEGMNEELWKEIIKL